MIDSVKRYKYVVTSTQEHFSAGLLKIIQHKGVSLKLKYKERANEDFQYSHCISTQQTFDIYSLSLAFLFQVKESAKPRRKYY